MNRKFHIKKGDLVQVNAGEDKGKQGKVLEVFPDKERAIVEGINMIRNSSKGKKKAELRRVVSSSKKLRSTSLT